MDGGTMTCGAGGKIGDMPFLALSDGPLDLGLAADVLKAPAASPSGIIGTTEPLVIAQNVLALRMKAGWVLFETGARSVGSHIDAGQLPASLERAGIDRAKVVALVPTHAHLDHIGGISDAQGQALYPNAAIHMADTEMDFWLDDHRLVGQSQRSASVARANLLPNLGRVVRYQNEQEILPGIHAFPTHGHTIGHTGFLISAGGDNLFVAGDLAHDVRQIAYPEIATNFDFDRDMAISARRKTFDFLAGRHILTLFYHFPWPGLGYIEKISNGFRFAPISF